MRKAVQPWYRAQTDTWYTTVGGKQVPLARGREQKAEAERAFHRLMLDHGEGIDRPVAARSTTVVALFDLFLDHSQRHNKPATYEWYRRFLQDFAGRYPRLGIDALKPFHVSKWLDAHADWGTARWGAITAVKRALNWATDEGLIPANPVKGVKKPTMPRRERILTSAEFHTVYAATKDTAFREFLTALRESGARPGEVAAVTAADVDVAAGVWTLADHKTRGKTGKPRVIYLTPSLLDLTRELIERHPTGPLFCNKYGQPWRRNAIRCRFRRLRKTLGLGADVVAYSLRHTFATDALENGVPAATVAELLGHTDLTMLSKHYAKLSQKRDHLRKSVAQAVGGTG